MKILYDGWIFDRQAAGGINRYFANIIDGLPADCLPSITTRTLPAVNWPSNPQLKVLRPKQFRPHRVARKLSQAYFDRIVGSDKYDILHPSYYATFSTKDWQSYPCPIVLTVYDMTHERFADTIDTDGRLGEEKRRAVNAADSILCISQSTKRDLIEYCAVPESKIIVTYLAAELNADLSHGPENVPARPYLLYVGSRASYKNFDGLLVALSHIATAGDEIALCVVGPPFDAGENQRIADLGLAGCIEHYGYANDAQLAKLYRCSLAFVYPSLYEGFGIPPLEAMQCGTPVVACNSSSIPEVVGDAGLLFEPDQPEELTDILRAVVDGSIARDQLIEKGHRQARKFSWKQTVDQTVEVYRALSRSN